MTASLPESSLLSTGRSAADDLLELARTNQWESLDERWLGCLENVEDGLQFDRIFLLTKTRRSPAAVVAMLELLLDTYCANPALPPMRAVDILERGLPHIHVTGAIRQSLVKLAPRLVAPEVAEALTKRTGLTDDKVTAKHAVDAFLRLLHVAPGEVLLHKYYHIGIVTAVDMDSGQMTMDFPDTNYKAMAVKFEHIEELIKPMPRGHFDTMRIKDPASLRQLGEEKPGELVRRIVETRKGEAKQADIKSVLLGGIYTDAEFKRWWGAKRAEVVRDPWLDVTGTGASCNFRMRETPKPYYREAVAAFVEATTFKPRLEAARNILRASRDGAFPPEAWQELIGPFTKAAAEKARLPKSDLLAWELLRSEMAKQAPADFKWPFQLDVPALLRSVPRVADVLTALDCPDHLATMIPLLREVFPDDWKSHYHDVIERVAPRFIDAMLKELVKAGAMDIAADSLGRVLSFPERNPEGYLWAMKSLLEGSMKDLPVGLEPSHLIEDLLSEYESLENGPPRASKEEEKDRRALALRISKFLSEKHYAVVAEVVAKMPVEDARAFYNALDKRRLPADFLDAARSALVKTRNDLKPAAKPTTGPSPEDLLLCTEASQTAKLKEYNRLNEVDIPANSAAIGAAAQLGDLRENFEYHSAKDQQKVLFSRVEELSIQLRRCRVVKAEQIDTKSIGFGMKVEVADEGGKTRQFVILGPWESDPAKGIISFLAPLGRSFMGRTLGEKFQVALPDGTKHTFEVKKIENAL